MDPSEWGPAGWTFLHSITFGQPEHPNAEQAKHIRQFFTSLGYVLPCKRCGEHYRQFVEQNPIPADDREKLTKWLVRLHNNANASSRSRLPVKLPEFRYEDAVRRYAYDRDVLSNPPGCGSFSIGIMILFVTVAMILVAGAVALLVYSCSGGRTCPINDF